MRRTIEEAVPYERSALWRIHDQYFARGSGAWTSGEVPSLATSNYAVARQHGALLLRVVKELEEAGALGRDERVEVLEVGVGAGAFAACFLRALATGCGPAGRALLARLRYFLSDFTPRVVNDAIAVSELARHVSEGRVVPALFDLRRPDELRSLDGRPLETQLCAVIANYVVCVSPMKVVRRSDGVFEEKLVALSADVLEGDALSSADPDGLASALLDPAHAAVLSSIELDLSWRPVADLDEHLGSGLHADVVRDATAPFDCSTVIYPWAWLSATLGLRARSRAGALVLVNDYGHCDLVDLGGLQPGHAQRFGGSLAHPVNTAVIDLFARRAGLTCVRTQDPLSHIHVAAMRFAERTAPAFERGFQAIYRRTEGEDFVQFTTLARERLAARDFKEAARLLERLLVIDRDDVETVFLAGVACLECGLAAQGLGHLRRGARLPRAKRFDFGLHLGRAYVATGDPRRGARLLRKAVAQRPVAETHVDLALAYVSSGEQERARRSCEDALALEPALDRAVRLRDALGRAAHAANVAAGAS